MENIMKYKTKSVLSSHQIQYLKVNKKIIQNNSIISKKIDENNLKFLNSRQFGNDLTLSIKNVKRAINHKITSKNKLQEQNKVIIILLFTFQLQSQIYIKKLSPSSQILRKVNKQKIKINNDKKTSSIYHNKTGFVLDKRKNSIINNKNICNYASKSNNYSNIDSFVKPKINAKKNNSVCFVNGYQKSRESFIKSKNNESTINNNMDLNTTNYNIL